MPKKAFNEENQGVNRGPKSPKKASSASNPEIAARIKEAVVLGGGNKVVSEKTGISVRTLGNYIAGLAEPRLSVIGALASACGVSLHWLVYGEGEKASDLGLGEVHFIDFTATLESIEQRLEKAVVPFPVPPPPEWRSVYDELREIAESPAATDNCRLRADTLLRLAFNDQDAIERFNIKLKDMGTRLREGRAAYAAALKAVGWEPPQAIGFAIADAMVFNGLDYDGAVTILKALKDAV